MIHPGPAEHPSSGSVLEILGLAGAIDPEAVVWSVVTPESRHSIWRLVLPDAAPAPPSYVVKSYHVQSDRYFDHRYRREERILDLVGRYAPELAPRAHGGRIIAGHSAYLVLEDLGDRPLHNDLDAAGPDARLERLGRSVELLAAFHRVSDEFSGISCAVCRGSILDRVNVTTLRRRLQIAVERMTAGSAGPALRSHRAGFSDDVIRPLLQGRQRVIHNSFSPLNICTLRDGSQRIVDMETVSIGPAELDLAELLIYPGYGSSDRGDLAARYSQAMDLGSPTPESRHRLHLAAVLRALDYAGTLAQRQIRFAEAGLPDLAEAQQRRGSDYRRGAMAHARLASLPDPLIRFLEDLTSATGGTP